MEKMNEVCTEDPFMTISQCGIKLPDHIVFLLKKLGYNSLIAISKLDAGNIKDIEIERASLLQIIIATTI